jgi:hypothetical protein
MADIDVVPKHRSGLSWPILLVIAAVVIVVLWWFLRDRTATRTTGQLTHPAPIVSVSSPTPIAA